MKRIVVSGTGMTRFGELWQEDISSLASAAAKEALEEAKIALKNIDLVLVGNMLAQQVENRAHGGALIAEALGYYGPATHVEAACASGGLAVRHGVMALKSSLAKNVLVVGVEKMTDVDSALITRSLMGAGGEDEQWAGATFPSLYALMMQAAMNEWNSTERDVAKVAVASHEYGFHNPLAHFQKQLTVEDVLSSDRVADPIRQLMCAPISDGAAAVVLRAAEENEKKGEVEIIGSGQGGDSLSLAKRESLTTMKATKIAIKEAIKEASITTDQIDIAEVHDCFSIAQLMAVNDLGLKKKTVINTSGGLKACGHPVGATGVKQVVEVTRQLEERCGQRQVSGAQLGVTHNVGGTGATAVVHLLRRTA